jgi:hypothetical protein
MKRIRSFLNSATGVVRDDPDNPGVEDRRVRSGKLDQFLETGPSPFLIAACKNQDSGLSAVWFHIRPFKQDLGFRHHPLVPPMG